jgi:hypothetical protein
MFDRRAVVLGVALVVTVTACGTVPVTPSAVAPSAPPASPAPPSPVPAVADVWRAVDLTQPSIVTIAPSMKPGSFCSPCHAPATGQLLGVGPSPGGLIAVGVQQPPAQAVALSSTDGTHWVPLPGFSGATGSSADAEASNGARAVIVGLDHSGATAWASDGGAWTQAPTQHDLLVPYAAGAMTSVTAFGDGFVAAGYRDDPLHDRASASVWRSNDGLTWTADGGSGTFGGGRIWGIAAKGGTLVAVGTSGDPNYGPAAAWRWTETSGWQRGRIAPGAVGAMLAVAVTASGFVAVGQNGHNDGALAWSSPDGLVWTAAPDQPAFHYFLMPVRMQSVVAGPTGLIAGGWRSDDGNGSAVTWTSANGLTWNGPVWEPSFSGGQISGLAVSRGAVTAVGRTGYPDNNQAAIWVSAAP